MAVEAEVEFQAMPMAYVQLPMTNSPSATSKSIPLPNATIEFEEIKIGDKFDRLKITVEIDEDPRLKAVDIFTQYGGINFLLIKHSPRVCASGKNPMIFYSFYPNWDNRIDRIITTKRPDPEKMVIPVNYESVSGLLALSLAKETSSPTDPQVSDSDQAELTEARLVVTNLESTKLSFEGSLREDIQQKENLIGKGKDVEEISKKISEQMRELINIKGEIKDAESKAALVLQEMRRISYSKLELGMVKGQERVNDSPSYYGKEDDVVLYARFTDPGGGDEPLPWKVETTGFYMNSENPLGHYTFVFVDRHPIPLAVYSVVGYLDDSFGDNDYNPKYKPQWLALASYNPEHLKAGTIVKIIESSLGWYTYIVKTVNTLVLPGNKRYKAPSNIPTGSELLKYEIGRWVVIQKASNGVWYIVPSSSSYWEDAVEYLREFVPF